MIPGYLTDGQLARLGQTHPELDQGCPTCKGTGAYRWAGVVHECDCREQRRLYTRYAHAGIGLTYQRLDWVDFPTQPPALADYLALIEEHLRGGIGLLLTGDIGVGKTMVANLILKDLVRRDWDCYATTFAETVENLIETWSDTEERREFVRRFQRSQVLLLDDLGKEFSNAFRARLNPTTFDYILRPRVAEARPTLLTTNMTTDEMRESYGAGVLSLLSQQSVHVHLTGADYRPHAHHRVLREIANGETRPIR